MGEKNQVNQAWFKAQLARSNMSLRQAAKHMTGIDAPALSRTLKGVRRMTLEEAGQLAILLNQPLDDVLIHAGLDRQTVMHKSATTIAIRGTIDATHTIQRSTRPAGKVTRPPKVPDDAEALVYQTAQTKLDVLDGWILYTSPTRKSGGIDAECIGRLSIVRLQDGREMVGFVRRGVGPRAYQLWDYNGMILKDVQLDSAAPVLWVQP